MERFKVVNGGKMRVDLRPQINRQNFGNLYMNEDEIGDELYDFVGRCAKAVRPDLEAEAIDADIVVRPQSTENIFRNFLSFWVVPKNSLPKDADAFEKALEQLQKTQIEIKGPKGLSKHIISRVRELKRLIK